MSCPCHSNIRSRTHSSIVSPWRPSKPKPAMATQGNSSPFGLCMLKNRTATRLMHDEVGMPVERTNRKVVPDDNLFEKILEPLRES